MSASWDKKDLCAERIRVRWVVLQNACEAWGALALQGLPSSGPRVTRTLDPLIKRALGGRAVSKVLANSRTDAARRGTERTRTGTLWAPAAATTSPPDLLSPSSIPALLATLVAPFGSFGDAPPSNMAPNQQGRVAVLA